MTVEEIEEAIDTAIDETIEFANEQFNFWHDWFEGRLQNMTTGAWSDFDGLRSAIELFLGFTNARQD